MSMERILRHVGITEQEYAGTYSSVRFFNHEYDNPSMLASVGTFPREEIAALTGGLFAQDIPITLNKRIFAYDHLLLVTPVVPHEAMGFAGGNKYFFPGIAGVSVLETFHWLAAVITNPVVNGVKDTPTRRAPLRGKIRIMRIMARGRIIFPWDARSERGDALWSSVIH